MTKTQAVAAQQQFRVTAFMVQLELPEGSRTQQYSAHLYQGDIVPDWAVPANVERLLELGSIEKIEAAA